MLPRTKSSTQYMYMELNKTGLVVRYCQVYHLSSHFLTLRPDKILDTH